MHNINDAWNTIRCFSYLICIIQLKGSQLAEPEINQAVLLELSKTQSQMNPATAAVVADAKSSLAPSLSRLDSLGSAALGQLLSNILDADEVDPTLAQKNKLTMATVNWPSTNREVALASDPRVAINILYQNLQNSGLPKNDTRSYEINEGIKQCFG